MSTEDLLFHMADKACVRAWEDEGWGPYHKRLLTMCVSLDYPGRKKGPTLHSTVLNHLRTTGTISIREAMDDYNLSGGHLTKIISDLRFNGHNITRKFMRHPVSGRRYARYTLHQDG